MLIAPIYKDIHMNGSFGDRYTKNKFIVMVSSFLGVKRHECARFIFSPHNNNLEFECFEYFCFMTGEKIFVRRMFLI